MRTRLLDSGAIDAENRRTLSRSARGNGVSPAQGAGTCEFWSPKTTCLSWAPHLPVIVLTARSGVEDRVQGLDLGADDYLTKPFSFSELSARVRALLRRGSRPAESTLKVEDLELDRVGRSVKRAGRRIDLTQKEFALLEYLMRNAGRRVTRAMIIEHVWNLSYDSMTNVVDVYVNYVRKKVDENYERKLIRTVRGVGYQLGGEEDEG
ncbi:MAG: response regulator transcription factor [Acidobacteria bacterium]|nr:response regulator transcription factor [Acidobacteriota bacterium]